MRRTPSAKPLYAVVLAGAAVLAGTWLAARHGLFDRDRAATQAAISANCLDCHDDITRSGDLVLEPATLADVGGHAEIWERVIRKVADRAMPPPDEPRPPERDYITIERFLEAELDAFAAARPNPGELPQLHRLTRTEYGNAIRDLLALDVLPAELDYELLLPADNKSSGFDNISELLFVSPSTMERYIDAARKISRLVVGDMSAAPLVNRHRLALQLPQDIHVPGLPIGTRGGLVIGSYFPLDGEYVVRVELAGSSREPHELEILVDGERVARSTVVSGGPGFPRRAPPLEFRLPVTAGPANIGVTFIERSEAFDESTLRVRRRSRGALPDIEHVTISGPFNPTGPGQTPSRERIFTCTPGGDIDERACAGEIVTALARRAYRRPVSETDLEGLWPFYEAGLADGGFDRGIQYALERILISPQFLYRVELDPPDARPGVAYAISDLELASRLSFFLWSSIPDYELLDLATEGRLRDPETLEAQIERMLADPRSESLVTNFAAQWLFLGDVESKDPDLYLFRDYDDTLRSAFAREAELFLDSVLRGNGSIVELLTASYTFVNERLAAHYGIANIEGSHFRRIELPESSPRAGLLGKGGILALTSYATRTSPVLRGKYVLENLLAAPPPAPPPDVPSLVTEDDGAALTMREALARHREDPACAGCHVEMDAIGFALENFDATGQWRDRDAAAPVDSTSALPDGTIIDGVAGLRSYLALHQDRFARAFTEKLLMYALGRNVQYYDAAAVRAIVRDAGNEGYAFASIVEGIARSVPFQMRNARDGATSSVAVTEAN
ncbi:DUF1592 domain-containing protein [Candidatus Rariloculus sp.]|uniref:DUF1592 domain-containing protein n=1 Tax=Candidatus Rariloculus sp. TaxID=3101265 RepID=UPI003D0E5ECA